MARFEVEPVPGYEDDVLEQYQQLHVDCADGFSGMMEILEVNEPPLTARCGLLADRYEIYAIPLPDCPRTAMILSVDRDDPVLPRYVHGVVHEGPLILPTNEETCNLGATIAATQFGLVNPPWET